MEQDKFEQYNLKRNELLKKYKAEKIRQVLKTLGIFALAIVIAWVLHFLKIFNIAVSLVLTAVFVMMGVIFARIRAVTVDHTRDEKLRLFEDSDPTFY